MKRVRRQTFSETALTWRTCALATAVWTWRAACGWAGRQSRSSPWTRARCTASRISGAFWPRSGAGPSAALPVLWARTSARTTKCRGRAACWSPCTPPEPWPTTTPAPPRTLSGLCCTTRGRRSSPIGNRPRPAPLTARPRCRGARSAVGVWASTEAVAAVAEAAALRDGQHG